MNKKKIILIIAVLIILCIIGGAIFFAIKSKQTNPSEVSNQPEQNNNSVQQSEVDNKDTKVDIVDVNSNSRPYAVVVNNTAVAVKVQEGLNKAYMVYEIPTEGNTSRLLALYKDINEELVIGTIRSARHNFIDFALESDAIFCCFGWSHYAEDDMKSGSIDYLQGLFGYPFYRENPENLATEHTAYTSMNKIKDEIQKRKIRTTSNESILLNYDTDDIDLSNASNQIQANLVKIPYGAAPQIASFKYDEATKMYIRYENSNKCIDHNTKEDVTTKNIIVQKIDYNVCDDNYYWNLHTTGKGKGYYITNGHAVPITWSKSSRKSKTVYSYASGVVINGVDMSGKEITVSDGRTWIEVQTNSQNLTIE